MFGALMMAAATAVGTWIGASHDGTPVPMMVTMAVAALIVLGAAKWLRSGQARDGRVRSPRT
jgi:hypothetical protein